MREAAHGLARRGWDVEMLTTCARDHYTWQNEYEPGTTTHDDGVVVHRFPVEGVEAEPITRPHRGAHPVGRERAARRPAGVARRPVPRPSPVPPSRRQLRSLRRGDPVAVPLLDDCHRRDRGPERTIVMPCLHDEPYARLEVLNPVLVRRRPPVVPVRARARARARVCASLPDHVVTGAGVHVPDELRRRRLLAHATVSTRPFLLFAGRRERGKGWDWLLAAFHFAIRQYDAAVRPRDDRREPGRHAGRSLGPRPRSRLSRRRRSRRRVRGRGRVRAAEHQRELLAHDHGVVARRHSGARGRAAATSCAGTAIAPAAASPSPTSSSSRSASRSSPPRPTKRRGSPRPGASTCSPTINGMSCSTRWRPACGSCCARPRSRLVPAAGARRGATGPSRPCTDSARRATTSTCSRGADRPRSYRGPIAGPAGALLAWWRGRRYDAVVVQIESGAPLRVSHGRRARSRPARRLPRVGARVARGAVGHDRRARHRRRAPLGRRAQRPFPLDRGRSLSWPSERGRRRLSTRAARPRTGSSCRLRPRRRAGRADDGWDDVTDAADGDGAGAATRGRRSTRRAPRHPRRRRLDRFQAAREQSSGR